jgi:hypothetical protein
MLKPFQSSRPRNTDILCTTSFAHLLIQGGSPSHEHALGRRSSVSRARPQARDSSPERQDGSTRLAPFGHGVIGHPRRRLSAHLCSATQAVHAWLSRRRKMRAVTFADTGRCRRELVRGAIGANAVVMLLELQLEYLLALRT